MYNPIVELSLIDVALNIMILFIICLKHQDHDILNYAVPCIMMFYSMLIKKNVLLSLCFDQDHLIITMLIMIIIIMIIYDDMKVK